jgi:hypothetical protein
VKCQNHPKTPATRSCHACLRPLCEECTQEVLGAFYCESCLAERLQPHEQPARARRARIKVPFLASLLSFGLPGLGQIYNGLVARALSQFIGFLLLVWTVDQVEGSGGPEGLLALLILGFWGWQVVDAWRTAKDINELGRVPDPDEARAMGRGAIPALDGGSKPLGVALMALGALLLLGNLGLSSILSRLIEGLWPAALLVLGVWLVRRSRDERLATERPLPVDDFELAPEEMEVSR